MVDPLAFRHFKGRVFRLFCTVVTWGAVAILGLLLFHVCREGLAWVDWQFLTSFPSRFPEKAGLKSALYGTIWLISLTGLFSISIGVAAAVYLEEYAAKTRLSRFIEINIANLAGVPSVVYGILGLVIFVRFFGFGQSVLSGSLIMTMLVLPIIIIASREAIRAVPSSVRQASFALGATRWQTVWAHVLPSALPGIVTSVILAMSRAIGETAPLVMMGGVNLCCICS